MKRKYVVVGVVLAVAPFIGVGAASGAVRSPLLTDGVLPLPPGFTSAGVVDLNDRGDVVAGGRADGPEQVVLWRGDSVSVLGGGSPTGLNNLGQVVGAEYVNGGSGQYERTPKLWQDGTTTVLAGPARSYVGTGDITDSGISPVTYPNSTAGYHMENIGYWRGGAFSRLSAPTPGPHVSLSVVTENGTTAGSFLPMSGTGAYAFRCDATTCARLAAYPGGTGEVRPVAANDNGVVVGNQNGVGLRWEGDQVAALPALTGAGDATVSNNRRAINKRGDIVGASGGRATLWRDGAAVELGSPGGGQSAAVAVNDLGDVVGWSRTPQGQTRVFLWRAGRSYDLGTAGQTDATPVGLNNTGTVIGTATTSDYRSVPLRWTVRPPR
ncbi:hypothetical protein [Actinokineospora globicatena]|uniref:hypothetical protein n=1 Tax=Actinokineospora globicatena TaxID=103729 RepID=UPI0020A48CA3|nr:hypothetical protein [Actinokineospora globicatena]MCP2306394.1 putative extracellular repeat, HAF family [Actinokineospora globicatena]GLW81820.1 hypothetical protein Aglo01_63010 [Actinokineospora globicatena]GLW88614.1 hypothetical protein Aglo02_62530 [Actinokineospora globicatena]